MIPKPINEITKNDIDALVENKVSEGRQIEYKRTLPGRSDEEKREFLADVSSFANAAGGDLLYGVTAKDGVPQSAHGLPDIVPEEEILRLEQIHLNGLEPRIPGVVIRPIPGFPQGPVLVIRVPDSWLSPHMVTFNKSSRFFTRNSAGKYQMNVTELRTHFALSETLQERIRRFRDDRLGKIIAGETPVPLAAGARIVLHLVPFSSFAVESRIAPGVLEAQWINLRPIHTTTARRRFNVDGVVTFRPERGGESASYCQAFRPGQIEAVCVDFVKEDDDGARHIPIVLFENNIRDAIGRYLEALKCQEVPRPILIAMTMLGAKGAYMSYGDVDEGRSDVPIDRDILILPEVIAEQHDVDAATVLRPIFDSVWNACGYERCPNYDEQGRWKHG